MLKTLFTKVRYKQADPPSDPQSDEAQAEPDDRRTDERYEVRRYNGNITNDGLRHQFRLRDLSCTGVSGLTAAPIEDDQTVSIELVKGVLWPATVRWTRGTSVGLSFRRPLPMYLVAAILEADQRHCRPAKDAELNLGPLTSVELSVIDCPLEEADDPVEYPQAAHGAASQDHRTGDAEEIPAEDQECGERTENPSCERPERRVEPRVRTPHLIARINSSNVSGLCCVRSISDSGLMAETSLILRPGDEIELEFSDRHQLCGRVVWTDKAGVGVALNEPVDSALLLSELTRRDAESRQAAQSPDGESGSKT